MTTFFKEMELRVLTIVDLLYFQKCSRMSISRWNQIIKNEYFVSANLIQLIIA